MGNNAAVPTSRLSIGVLSKRTGCKIETIRYYEGIELMPSPSRTESGHRVYGLEHLKRLHFIRRCRELGFTLDQVRALLSLVDGGYTCAEVKALTVEHLDGVRKKLSDLRKLERVLKQMVSQCEGGTVPECPVVESLFH